MFAELAVILIILITVAFSYLKGTIVKTFLLLINTLIASIIAFAYFETLGQMVIGFGLMPQFALAAVLILVFAFTLAILNAIGGKLITTDIYFGDSPDRIIKCLIAVFAGFAIAGVVLTAAAMLPLGTKLPYERFSETPGRSTTPQKTPILSADGFITKFVSLISRDSMSGGKSFAVFHPRFLDEIYLNRIGCGKGSNISVADSAISVESAIAPQTPLIASSDNQPISEGSQTKAVIVKVRTDGKVFTIAQVRLICKNKDSAENLKGSGQVFWPVGHILRDNVVNRKNLSDSMTMSVIDLVFYIPADTVPVMLQYKQNAVAQVGKLVTGETTPPPQAPAQQTPAQQTPAEQNSVKPQ